MFMCVCVRAWINDYAQTPFECTMCLFVCALDYLRWVMIAHTPVD